MAQRAAPTRKDLWARRMSALVTRLMRSVSRHWLLVANLTLALYVGLPLLAPVLMAAGLESWGKAIHTLFYPTCHQLPERSYFILGPHLTYTRPELVAMAGEAVPLRFVGNELVGYKMGVCQRCAAIYGGWLTFGLLFGLARKWLRPLTVRGALLLLVPMAVDGLGQLLGLWQSTWLTRTVTGLLFALAVVWLAYPYIERGMQDMHREAEVLIEEEGRS